MAEVTNTLLILPALAGLLALTQNAGDCGFNLEKQLASNPNGAIHLPANAEISKGPDGSPVLLRAEPEENEQSREAQPFSCLQMQAIDEVELIDEPTPRADCN
jgi:hypothetical protein